jgi:hypothetical protein
MVPMTRYIAGWGASAAFIFAAVWVLGLIGAGNVWTGGIVPVCTGGGMASTHPPILLFDVPLYAVAGATLLVSTYWALGAPTVNERFRRMPFVLIVTGISAGPPLLLWVSAPGCI